MEKGAIKPELVLIGAGPGNPDLLTGEAAELLRCSHRVLASPRIAGAFHRKYPDILGLNLAELRRELEREAVDTALLLSGDLGFYSLSASLRKLERSYAVRRINGVSSLQYFCARLGTSYEDVVTVSLHGRRGARNQLPGLASYCAKTFVLTGGAADVGDTLQILSESGIPGLKIALGEKLSLPGEKITVGTPEQLIQYSSADLAVLLVENPSPTIPAQRLPDAGFLRGGIPMTKEAVRALSVEKLEVEPQHVVWDIGAGTGSVSVALAYRSYRGVVWAVERNLEAVELCKRNREKWGAWNLRVVEGVAPTVLELLPVPDRVFIGGSGRNLESILDFVFERNSAVGICINAVTLETLHHSVNQLESRGIPVEVECVQSNPFYLVGDYHMPKAQNPVYIISGRARR